MWSYLIPFLLSSSPDPTTGKAYTGYNILIHSQRGHGQSTLPPHSSLHPTTIPALAADIAYLLKSLHIPTPVHSLVGVSQGGAAALALARSHPHLARSMVVCDTAARTPEGNQEAWVGRIELVYGGGAVGGDISVRPDSAAGEDIGKGREYAVNVGMGKLAEVTVPRWFVAPSKCGDGESERAERNRWMKAMVEGTDVDGFVSGALALSDYDLLQGGWFPCVLFFTLG